MKKTIITMAIMGLFLASNVNAQQQMPTEQLPQILKHANETRGWQIFNTFETESTLTGWVVNAGQGLQVAYTDPKGYLVLGELVTPDGRSLNDTYMQTHQPDIDFDAALKDVTFIDLNPQSDKPAVIVLYEPRCPYCSSIYAAMKPYINAGHPVKIMPVAFLSSASFSDATSADLLYSIMTSPNPALAIEQHENKTYSITPSTQATPEYTAKFEANFKAMGALNIMGTPAVFVPTENGYRIIKNMVSMDMLPAIFNTERMDSSDSRLTNFGSDPTAYPVK